jgi:hypothetical protein
MPNNMNNPRLTPMLRYLTSAFIFLGAVLNSGVVKADNPFVQSFYSADPA